MVKKKPMIVVAGLSNLEGKGNMARLVAEGVLGDDRMDLSMWILGGPESDLDMCPNPLRPFGKGVRVKYASDNIGGKAAINIFPPEYHEVVLRKLKKDLNDRNVIVVDFTHPDAVNRNAELYCELDIPFVMGTTGGDRNELCKTVQNSSTWAVIAPNMAKQIVGLQALLEFAPQIVPNLFAGYALKVEESHQYGKADTSGTAKAMVEVFKNLGADVSTPIKMIRNPIDQVAFGVPKEHLDGHGWHTYTLTSPDGTVVFQFTHNVNGRDIYVEGVKAAVLFLDDLIGKSSLPGFVLSMIDVLKKNF